MGLEDRDYMRRAAPPRAVGASGPPEPSAALTLLMIIVFTGATYGAYAAWRWAQAPRASTPVPVLSAPVDQPAPPAAPKSSSQAPSSRQPPARTDERSSRANEGTPATPADGTVRITKCVVDGVTSYSDGECAPRASSRSIVTLDRRQNLVDGLPPSARSFAQPSAAAPPPVRDTVPSVVDANVDKKSLCLAYEAEIKAIDARARQPLPGWEQDRLAAKRRAARDEQFRLRC